MSLTGERVLLKTPMNPSTGYGKDGIYLAQGLQRIDADLHLEPMFVGLPMPQDILPLFGKERPEGFEVAINHVDPAQLQFPPSMHLFANKTVGWTMYEFLSFGEQNKNEGEFAYQLAERLEAFDLVLAYDEVSRSALAEYMDEPDRLKILQGGYDAEFWRLDDSFEERDWDGTFRFCMNGTMNLRKNPWTVIHAFKTLKDQYGDAFDAELHLKTQSLIFPPVLEQWCPGLRIHYANWSAEDLKIFYSKMHCLLAPSWGEGKNLPALEAQTTGMPVIVSAFGGHMQWATDEWAYLVDGPIEEHAPGMGSMRVSAETMVDKMWHVYNNRAEARQKGALASSIIPKMCDWSSVVERLSYLVDETPRRERS